MTITVRGPGGVSVNFPDGTPPETIDRVMREATQSAPRATPPVSSQPALASAGNAGMAAVGDVVKSGGRGLLEGTAGVIGAPQDLLDVANAGMGKVTGWIGDKIFGKATPEQRARIDAAKNQQMRLLPTSGQTLGAIDAGTGNRLQYEPQTAMGDYARTIGQFIPAAATGGLKAVAAAVPAAVGSETAGRLTKGTPFEPYARIAGAIAAPAAAKKLITPFNVTPERAAAVSALKREGVDALTPGQATGSNRLKFTESELGGSKMADTIDRQGEQFTRAVLSKAGINASRATPDVIDGAFTRIGGEFDRLAATGAARADRKFVTDFRAALDDYGKYFEKPNRAPVVGNYAQEISTIISKNGGNIPAGAYKSLRSRMTADIRSAPRSEIKVALGDMVDALDGAMMRSQPQHLPAWQKARREYRNMLVIERAATGTGEKAAVGLITPSQLRTATKAKMGTRAYARGKTPFDDLARSGEAVGLMREPPNSGTPMRLAARMMFNLPAAAAGGYLGSALGHAAEGIVAGGMLPGLIGRAMLSRPGRAYLSNRLFPGPLMSPLPTATKALGATVYPRLQGP